jgi:hypothetical protein
MDDIINKSILKNKSKLLSYYREKAAELIKELKSVSSDTEYRKRAVAINNGLTSLRKSLISKLLEKAKTESWSPEEVLSGVLLVTYTNYVVMMESRNDVWPYEYMAFARRIGELWEPFCQLCWVYPVNDSISYIEPPVYSHVKNQLLDNIKSYIDGLELKKEEKEILLNQYETISALVSSGEINLELDLHFKSGGKKYVVDFKSGFSSNEKGNTNRLLLVANIYKSLNEGYNCLLFVRSNEETNNHYLQTLKKSGLWTVYCGEETYKIVSAYTGFDLASWMQKNINWAEDFDEKMYAHLKQNQLLQYLEW